MFYNILLKLPSPIYMNENTFCQADLLKKTAPKDG